MLLYYLFWMLMGLLLHFYIIFGTNLLTAGPAQIAVFLPISVFEEKEYQTESKWNETFGNVIFGTNKIQETWTLLQEAPEAVTRVGGTPPASWAPRSSTDALLPPIYTYVPQTIRYRAKTLIPPPKLSVSTRSHLGACSGAPPEGASITEGFYIIIAPPMKCG